MKITEIFGMSLQALRTNKMRALLTVLGVVVGIFSIVVIMTIITMLQKSIENGVSQLNKNTFQIQKYPQNGGGGPGWRSKYANRKDLTLDEYYRLEDVMKGQVLYMGAEQWRGGKVVKYGNKETNPNIQVAGETLGGVKTNNWNVDYGRDFMQNDIDRSSNVCLIGKDIVDKLFININPVGQVIRVDGHPLRVIGVLEEQPQMFGNSRDNYIVIPITTFQSFYGKYSYSVNIMIMSGSKEDYNDVIESAIGHLRTIRKDKPGEDNSFEIFSNESVIAQINDITAGVKIGALVVSIIALLAAGVGIMNIMLVSVTERTREIGIRKAIGAKKFNILNQFLLEAIILCLIGGILGVALGVGVGNLTGGLLNAQAAIPYDWVVIGLSLCVFVGIIFGTYPAYKASNLDPIEALRYE